MSPITTTADAERTIDDLSSLLTKLSSIVEQETELVHAGRLRHAIDLCKAKAELASQLHASSETLRANAKFSAAGGPCPLRCLAAPAGSFPRRREEERRRAGDRPRGVGRNYAAAFG